MNDKVNLCDNCSKEFATCDGDPIFNEESKTGDKVVHCHEYNNI